MGLMVVEDYPDSQTGTADAFPGSVTEVAINTK